MRVRSQRLTSGSITLQGRQSGSRHGSGPSCWTAIVVLFAPVYPIQPGGEERGPAAGRAPGGGVPVRVRLPSAGGVRPPAASRDGGISPFSGQWSPHTDRYYK
ncbi:hypothetical protein GCM10010466_30430 [Planomonospora alba]|uniref:Uncharacterized protein n=1 Tax=Planomonospora alba TaxID=161354 RepID=A0ABP6N834_9ACTN